MLGEIGRMIYEGRRFKAFIIILLLHYDIRRNTKGAGVGEQPECAYDITRAHGVFSDVYDFTRNDRVLYLNARISLWES